MSTSSLVDADVHLPTPSIESLVPFMSDHWKEWSRNSGFKGPTDDVYPPKAQTSWDPQLDPANALEPGALAEAVLSKGAKAAVLNCSYAVDSIRHPYLAAELANALNAWQRETWLGADNRFFGSIVIPPQAPALAVAAIERHADDSRFVQILLPARAEAPYGNLRYHPIFRAAEEQNLVVSIQYGGFPGIPNMSGGWASHLFEEHAGMAFIFQTHLASLVYEGVFDLFPNLRVTFVESGFTWLPPFLWRIDKGWKGLRRETPWVKRLPSQYILEHVKFTAQPLDSVSDSALLGMVIEQLQGQRVLMYASDYPHHHSCDALETIRGLMSQDDFAAFSGGTADSLYRLEPRLERQVRIGS